MKKLLVTTLMACGAVGGAMFASSAMAEAGAERSYTVQHGDTLWDISQELIEDSADRNQAWLSNQKLLNPDLIFPGDVVKLTYVNGAPQLSVQRGMAVAPQRSETMPSAVTTAAPAAISLEQARKNISSALAAARPDLRVTGVVETPVNGIYKTTIANGPAVYSTADGQFFMAGELFRVQPGAIVNLTEQEMNGERARLLAEVNVDDMIVFSPAGDVKGVVSVFTDVDCGYCQKLHNEVPQLNAMGIEVRYLAFPRMGIGSGAYNKIVSAWCAADKQDALTKLKSRKSIPENLCAANPVNEQYATGQQMGISGTPAIVLNNGELIPGYVPADKLAARIGL